MSDSFSVHRCSLTGCLVALALAGCEEPAGPATVEGVVRDAYTHATIAHARVEIDGSAVTTDREGRFEITAREGTHRLELSAAGYFDGARARVVFAPAVSRSRPRIEAALFPRVVRDSEVARHFAEVAGIAPREIEVRGRDAEGDIGAIRTPIHDLSVAMPDRILVWRSQGTPLAPSAANGWRDRSCDSAAIVDDLAFEEYVKGVIPHEWVPSWHREALMAGAIAARSYALSHHLRGGRWACADVDDGTVTQVYRDDRAGPTDEAVEATRGQIAIRAGGIVFAEYSAENANPTADAVDDPTCTGETQFGHGRGMCQWGTQRWATGVCANPPCDFGALGSDPKDHVWMVEHYYPGATVEGGAHIGEPCDVLPPEGGTIDDRDLCAFRYGPGEFWRDEMVGFAGSLRWTNAFDSATPSNWGRFELHFEEAGRYRVETYIEPGFAGHTAVRYEIDHSGGMERLEVDQRARDGWVLLGEHRFDGSGEVRILDTADLLDADRRIAFDAVRLTRLDGPAGDAGVRADAGAGDAGGPFDGGTGSLDGGPDGGPTGGCTALPRRAAPAPMALVLACLLALRRRRA